MGYRAVTLGPMTDLLRSITETINVVAGMLAVAQGGRALFRSLQQRVSRSRRGCAGQQDRDVPD